MTTSTIHNPTNFEPRDYVVEDYFDNHRPEYFGQPVAEYEREVREWERAMEAVFGPSWRAKIHRCVHCGNGTVRWITAVRHTPTGDVVVFGAVCTDRLGFANKVAFKLAQLQARAEARKVRFTIWTKREKFLAERPRVADVLARIDDPVHTKNWFVRDVLRRLDQYGELSLKQVNAIVDSLARDVEYAAKQAAAETEPKGAAPSGRQIVTGVVLSTKWVEGFRGSSTQKMLLKLDDASKPWHNSKVWLTVPGKETIERGDRVTIRATWEPSRDDAHFGFGSRPHLVSRTPVVTPSQETTSTQRQDQTTGEVHREQQLLNYDEAAR